MPPDGPRSTRRYVLTRLDKRARRCRLYFHKYRIGPRGKIKAAGLPPRILTAMESPSWWCCAWIVRHRVRMWLSIEWDVGLMQQALSRGRGGRGFIPEWLSNGNQRTAIAVADLDNDGRPELIVLQVERRVPGPNARGYVGKKLDTSGNVTGGWSAWQDVPDYSRTRISRHMRWAILTGTASRNCLF